MRWRTVGQRQVDRGRGGRRVPADKELQQAEGRRGIRHTGLVHAGVCASRDSPVKRDCPVFTVLVVPLPPAPVARIHRRWQPGQPTTRGYAVLVELRSTSSGAELPTPITSPVVARLRTGCRPVVKHATVAVITPAVRVLTNILVLGWRWR